MHIFTFISKVFCNITMSNEIKVALKEAREMFKENKYADVIKKCKKVLKADQNNYGALILLAAAMREIEEYKAQVPLVLQKAVHIQTDNPLAWQGLIAYYEKNLENNDCCNKLILAYCKLLEIYSDSKFTYVLNKISELPSQSKDTTALTRCIEHLSEVKQKLDNDKVKLIDKTLGWILVDNYYKLEKYQDLLESIFKSVIDDLDIVDQQNIYRKYLKILYNKGESIVLIDTAINMHQRFPQDVLPLEYICRVYCEQNVLGEHIIDIGIDIPHFYGSLIKLDMESETAAIAKAIYLKKSDDLVTARQILKDILQLKPCSIYGWIALGEISLKLHCWEDAENATSQALEMKMQKVSSELLYKVELILIESLSRSNNKQKWESAFRRCQNLHISTKLEVIYARISILLDKPNIDVVLNNLELRSETKMQVNILRALYLKRSKKFDEAINALDAVLETSEAWLLLGVIYWERKEYNYSLMAFLNGIKADRYNWICLVYLGHYYCKYGNDMERSRRCYQTALQINPNSEEAGIGLSTAFRFLKNQDANIKLLQTLTVQDSGPKWAWLQLGLQYLDLGDAAQAIKAFQHVIRADPNDNHSWESFADAYFVRGAYTSALKSYQRALELCPQSLYPMIQLGNIKLIIGQYREAKKDFECILLKEPCYVAALKGLAETCLALAKDYTAKQFLGRANDCLQQAMDSLIVALKERKNVSCIWKLLGDVCYRVAILPEKYSYLKVPAFLISHGDIEKIVLSKRPDMFSLAARCYCCALFHSPQSALLWHDLASCYLMQLQVDPLANHKSLASKCLAAGKHAVKLCPSTWLHWNLLGVICMSPYIKNYALAQHAYIMAIDKELSNAVIWSNLGTLYLYIGHVYKANEAYSQAQRADPTYINSWIGQALIAEDMGVKDAMDLFRHATQLGYHNQAAVGYTYWVLNAILKSDNKKDVLHTYIIENMHAIYVAADVMAWYIEHYPNDAYARNAYGLLLERQKLYKSAAEQFAAALCISTDVEKDLVCVNLARVLLKLQKCDDAINLCHAVKNTNYNSQCHLALAFFKAARYEESYNTYEATLHMFANTEIEKAYTLCAMAAIAYTFHRIHDAKTLLLQCIQIQPPIVIGLLAAAALGILHGDINLTTLVLTELESYRNHSEYGHHVVNLCAYFYIIGKDIERAVIVLSKAIFMHPDDTRYWLRLLRILLETDYQMFSNCAQKVLFLSRNNDIENVAHVACALSFNCLMESSVPGNIRRLQKLLFTYPGNIESWATLIAAFLSRSVTSICNIDRKWLLAFITITQQKFGSTEIMTKWLSDSKQKLKQLT